MPEIGLFPLELVLLPSERVPLHIFEDRYKELIGECLAEGSEFGLILETDGGLREIGTSTAVLEVIHTFDDGRMNVLVEGHDRFRVARFVSTDTLTIRLWLPALSVRQLARLPEAMAAAYRHTGEKVPS